MLEAEYKRVLVGQDVGVNWDRQGVYIRTVQHKPDQVAPTLCRHRPNGAGAGRGD